MRTKNLRSIVLFSLITLVITSCGKSMKQQVEGKWRWESIQQKSGDMLSMMDDELYFSFKKGQYLYTDVSSGSTENWADAVPFVIDEKTKRMTVITKAGNAEHYILSFTEGDHLNLKIDDPESSLYQDTWILKKVK